MQPNQTTLTFDELAIARTAIRIIRYLTVLAAAVAMPLVVALATPFVGWAMLATIVLSPLVLCYVLVAAARQAERERRARA